MLIFDSEFLKVLSWLKLVYSFDLGAFSLGLNIKLF